ncbi:MAG: hypothetical protein WD267_02855 [Balneolales bacterium]
MKTKTKVVLSFVTLFVLGFATGYMFSNAITPSINESKESGFEQTESRDQRQRGSRDTPDERQADRWRDRFSNFFDLTEAQKDPFFEHFSEYRSNIRSSMRNMRERENEQVLQHYNDLRHDLENVLNPGQLEKLETHLHPDSVKNHHSRRQRRGR